MNLAPNQTQGSGNKKIFLIVIAVVILVALSAASWYFFGKRSVTMMTEDGNKLKYTTVGDTTTMESEDGSWTVGENVKLPKDFPKNLPVFEDMKLTTAWSGNQGQSNPDDDTSEIKAGYTGTTGKSCQEVNDWYESELKKLGWKIDFKTSGGLTASKGAEICGTTAMELDGNCEVSLSIMDKSEMPVTTSTGEKDHDKIIEEMKDMEELQRQMDAGEIEY